MTAVIEALLDLSNIVGGFLLALALLAGIPQIGDGLARAGGVLGPFGWIVGIVALVCGGYFLIYHLLNGPHIFHFELVAIGVGIALLWDRLTGRAPLTDRDGGTGRRQFARHRDTVADGDTVLDRSPSTATTAPATGWTLVLAIFGIIAIIVGFQGLFTPN
jgi:hypothetical protein